MAATLGLAAPAVAAPQPAGGTQETKVKTKYCFQGDEGTYNAGFAAKSTVKYLREPAKKHYLKTNIRIDYYLGAGRWKKLEGRKNSTTLFKGKNLPYFTTPAVRTQVGPTVAESTQLRGTVTVKLMQPRTGPDKTIWSLDVSRMMACQSAV